MKKAKKEQQKKGAERARIQTTEVIRPEAYRLKDDDDALSMDLEQLCLLFFS